MARQSFTLDDLRTDSSLASLFGAPRLGEWQEMGTSGGRSFTGSMVDDGSGGQRAATQDDLDAWFNNLGSELSYGARTGDKENTQWYYTRQPDGTFNLTDTRTAYRPSSWISARDNVIMPTLAAAGAMTGLSGLGAQGYLGADVAASTAAQGGIPFTAGGSGVVTGGSGLQATPGTGTTLAAPTGTGSGLTATAAPGGLGTGLAAPIGTGAGLTAPIVNPIGSNIGSSIIPNPVSDNVLGGNLVTPGGTPPGVNPLNPGGTRPPALTQPGGPNTGGGSQNPWGNTLGALFGMYNANEQRKRYDDLLSRLDSLYAVDSPYATQMADELARRDSAAGRGSQYGPRSVELAAKLTDSRRQALGQMALPIAGMGVTSNLMADNLNNLFTGENGNIWDAAGDIWDAGSGAWDWFNQRFPSVFGD
jgi:hypothetical protein